MQPIDRQSTPVNPPLSPAHEPVKEALSASPLSQLQGAQVLATPSAVSLADIVEVFRKFEREPSEASSAVASLSKIIQTAKSLGDHETLANVATAINQEYWAYDQYFGGPRHAAFLVELARSDYAPLRLMAMGGLSWFDADKGTYGDNKRDIDRIVTALGSTKNEDERAKALRVCKVDYPSIFGRMCGFEPQLTHSNFYEPVIYGLARLLANDNEFAGDKKLQKVLGTIQELEEVDNRIYLRSPPLGNWRRMKMRH